MLLLAILLLAGCFACRRSGSEASGSGETIAFDFSNAAGGLPEGWSVSSYEGGYTLFLENGEIGFETLGPDDCRFVYTAEVSPETGYVLSADIRTENVRDGQGASLSIDNFALDGSYIYSDTLFGTNDWTPVTLAFRTADTQQSVVLALRLGGYSNESGGSVRFRNVRLEQTENAPVPFQNLIPYEYEEEEKERTVEDYENVFTVIFWAGAIAAIVLLFGVRDGAKKLAPIRGQSSSKYRVFPLIVIIGLIIRMVLCAKYKGHATDLSCWRGWGSSIVENGAGGFYESSWCDYPPAYMLVCSLLFRIEQALPQKAEWLRIFVYMVPPFLCDVLSGWLLLHNAKRFGIGDKPALLLAGLIVLNPAAVFLSGAWGQIDSVLTVMLIGTFLLLNESQKKPYYRLLAGLLYGLAILTKWQALLVGPVLALMYIMTAVDQYRTKRFKTHILWTVAAVLGALFVLLLGTLLFRGENMSILWLVERFLTATDGYNYASVEGYNFLTLFGGNWARLYIDDEATVRVPLAMFGNASVGEIFLQCNELFSRAALLIGIPTLVLRAWNEMRTNKDGRKKTMFYELLGTCAAVCVFGFLRFLAANFTSESPGGNDLLKAINKFPLYGLLMIGAFAGIALHESRGMRLRDWAKKGGATVFGTETLLLAACAFGATFLLALIGKLFGADLTWKLFGVLGIATACALTAGLFILYWIRHRRSGYSVYGNRGLIFLLAAFFMVWIFTFGHKMHERYILPVLFFLAFAYAYDRDPHKLSALCMLTVTTFMNEMVAMYVVSDGAAHVIRGGELHNKMIALVSLLEVASALYFTAVSIHKALVFDPGDPAAEGAGDRKNRPLPDQHGKRR